MSTDTMRRKDTPFFSQGMSAQIFSQAQQFVEKQESFARKGSVDLAGFATPEPSLIFNFGFGTDTINKLSEKLENCQLSEAPPKAPSDGVKKMSFVLESKFPPPRTVIESLATLTKDLQFAAKSPAIYEALREIAEKEEWETPYALLPRFEPVKQEDGNYSMPTDGVEVPSLESGYYETEDIVQMIHLLALAPTRKALVKGSVDTWVMQLSVLKEQMLHDVGMLCCDKPGGRKVFTSSCNSLARAHRMCKAQIAHMHAHTHSHLHMHMHNTHTILHL